MAGTIEMDMTQVDNPKWKKRSIPLWKGDTINGWQICMDSRRTNGNVGQVMPIIINYPTGGQFTSHVHVERAALDENGNEIIDPVTGRREVTSDSMQTWRYKGFVPAHEAKGRKPSQAIVDALLERHVGEMRQTLEHKLAPSEIDAEVRAFQTLVYRANGIEDPELSKQAAIRAEQKRKKG